MTDDLEALETWAEALLTKLNPAQRRQLLHRIALDLRRNQAERIASQRAPNGTGYTPRKKRKNIRGKHGRIQRQKAAMFNKLRTTKHLKTRHDANQLAVGFFGRVARIARVHQEGLQEKINPNSAACLYPKRLLLGWNANDHKLIRNFLLQRLK